MTTNGASFNNKCRFCQSPFSNDIIRKIEAKREDVYCENCGDILKRADGNTFIEPKNEKFTNIPFIVDKPPQDLSIPQDALLYPNGSVFYDSDFPLNFKKNFIVVFARLIYFHALRLEKEGKINMEELEIEDDLINDLHIRISPIHNKRIKEDYLKNLQNITLDEFELNLKKLQRKFHDNRQYREDFIPYSTWLIKRVLTIISEIKPKEKTPEFERLILSSIDYFNKNKFSYDSVETIFLDKIRESVNKFEVNEINYDDFLTSNVSNFLILKKNGSYDKLITQFKKNKRRALILKKGFVFSRAFNEWLSNEYPKFSDQFNKIDENFELLQYVVYELIEESNKPLNERKFLKEFASYIGVSPSTITNFGKKLGELGIIDYDSKFSINNSKIKEERYFSRDLGLIDHNVMNNYMTIYFRNIWDTKYYAEPYIFKPISLEHPDGLIVLKQLSKTFKNFFNSIFLRTFTENTSIDNYDYILFDYTSLTSRENVKNKIKKYFPPHNTLLLIVGYGLERTGIDYRDFSDIPFNVKVISPSLLANLIPFKLSKNGNFQKIFDIIVSAIIENDFEKLIEIREKTRTKLNKTETLLRDLQTSNLSSIFNFTNKSSEFIRRHVEKIKTDIVEVIKEFRFSLNVKNLANIIVDNIDKSNEISLSYDYKGYVGASIYASSKFLLSKTTQEDITSFLKISNSPLKDRLNDIKINPKLMYGLLIHALINKILKLLKITDEDTKKKIFEILKLLYEYYMSSVDKTIAFCITIVYLVLNRYNQKLSQRELCETLNYNNRNGITLILEDLTQINEILLNFGIDNTNIKKNRLKKDLIELLKEKGALTTKQIVHDIGFNCRRDLKKFLTDKIIEKELRFIGRTKTAFWKLPNTQLDLKKFDPLREKVINLLANYQFLTTKEISNHLEKDTKTIYKYLSKLEEKKLIEKSVKREGRTFRAYWKII